MLAPNNDLALHENKMDMYFYRGEKPNFGDELNHWMWPKLIESVWDPIDNDVFVGIGSIIFDFFPKHKRKIVFGAGYGGYTALPIIDDKWKIYFVRGKLTARALNIDEKLGIGDSAILLRSCIKNPKIIKKHKVSFIPHWGSTTIGNWETVCKYGEINYIYPCDSIESVINQILESELVITEAMHGAIVSDALRVPWIPLSPLANVHSMKWFDWASALNMKLEPFPIKSSSLLEFTVSFLDNKKSSLAGKFRRRGQFLQNIFPEVFVQRASKALKEISLMKPNMSDDSAMEFAHEQMLSKIDDLVVDLGKGKVIY